MNRTLLLFFCLFLYHALAAQGVAINTTGAPAHGSAMLDITSTTKGVLITRMTTAQRTAIALPAPGLVVYDLTTSSFWYRTGAAWVEMTDNFHGLRDADHDTQVQVEQSPDEDIIRFDVGGVEGMYLEQNTNGATRLDFGPNLGLIIGRNAGLTSFAGWNTILGPYAGQFNSTGQLNVMVGYRAGEDNATQNRNVFVGAESGANNTGGFNTFLGYRSGYANLTGISNTFLGNEAGVQNTTGSRNAFVGYLAGHNNEISSENTFVGNSAGYNTEADRNTFYGYEAGLANRTGLYNIVIGGEAAGTNLSNRDMGNGNTIVGYEAAQMSNGLLENVLIGYRSGFNMTSGIRNVLIGANAGYSAQTAFANVGVGPGSLRNNLSGNRNVAVGDSSLYSNQSSVNVAVGSRAGMDNTSGSGNTFVGNQAGMRNTTGPDNTYIGNKAGNFNKTGAGNVGVGDEAGYANNDGNNNTFLGLASGFRNESGDENVFAGRQAGEYNTTGNSNIAIGLRAGNQNQTGSNNIAIGEYALGAPTGTQINTSNNIAIGKNAGSGAIGTSNIIIGNSSGPNIANTNNVLLGNNITSYGYSNTFLGSQTSASIFGVIQGATAVGYNTNITQSHTVILGDASNAIVDVGIGTTTPDTKLTVNGTGGDILHLYNNAIEAMTVRHNGIIVMDQLVYINTTDGKSGYELSVDGEIVCEEVLVEASEDWPDYVFAKDYALMELPQLRTYLKEHQHLPNIPSAAEVRDEGIKLGDMQKRLLEKIEELTLYILQLETRIHALENK